MSEVKPTASQQAREDQARAEGKKSRPKDTTAATQQGAKAYSSGVDKKGPPSAFEELLNQMAEGNQSALAQEGKFDSRLRELRHEDRSSDSDKEEDQKSSQKSEGSKKSKDSQASSRERISAKHGMGEKDGDSSKGSGDQKGSQSSFQQKSSGMEEALAVRLKKQAGPAPSPEMPKPPQGLSPAAQATASPRELPKAVLDQIVQYVRIGMNREREKEIQVDFHDNFFNGLKLKVTSHGKEVSVEFMAPNRAVRDLLRGEREKIATVLGEKGIDVRALEVLQT